MSLLVNLHSSETPPWNLIFEMESYQNSFFPVEAQWLMSLFPPQGWSSIYPRIPSSVHSKKSFIEHLICGFPGRSAGKEPTCECKRHGFDPWVRKISWRRKWQPTPVFLPGKSRGQSSLACCRPWGLKESDTTECTHMQFNRRQCEDMELKKRDKIK